ncbi:hypothetical protein NM688_g3343 [Phlebia brevispora]|uniref:Uncharacterized protein n=1 Tax=Phlebia brevispora TaxID=194682 RepID=A0ACC1T677_9APHY|nr:hypothetical protein NM688_g3343 [Phlebia brevispora]
MPEYTDGGDDSMGAIGGAAARRVVVSRSHGGGSHQSDILKDTLYTWNSERNASFPAKVTFRYTLPTHYTHRLSGERFRLPPTYEAHLDGMPGFNVEIHYAIVVTISRTRDRLDWWRKTTKLRIPFRYRELSRPSQLGPFPLSLTKTPSGPKTLFKFTLQSRRSRRENIDVQLFLPASQVCTMREPIPFFVTLFASDDVLEPFGIHRPSPTSFHPLSTTNSSSSSLQQQLIHRTSGGTSPVRVSLQRQTQVDALAAGMPTMRENTHIAAVKTLVRGVIHAMTRSSNSITWSGAVELPPSVRSGGFVGSGIKVNVRSTFICWSSHQPENRTSLDCLFAQDSIVLAIVPPDGAQSTFMQFSASVPVHLTTEAYDCYSAAVAVSEWL